MKPEAITSVVICWLHVILLSRRNSVEFWIARLDNLNLFRLSRSIPPTTDLCSSASKFLENLEKCLPNIYGRNKICYWYHKNHPSLKGQIEVRGLRAWINRISTLPKWIYFNPFHTLNLSIRLRTTVKSLLQLSLCM